MTYRYIFWARRNPILPKCNPLSVRVSHDPLDIKLDTFSLFLQEPFILVVTCNIDERYEVHAQKIVCDNETERLDTQVPGRDDAIWAERSSYLSRREGGGGGMRMRYLGTAQDFSGTNEYYLVVFEERCLRSFLDIKFQSISS